MDYEGVNTDAKQSLADGLSPKVEDRKKPRDPPSVRWMPRSCISGGESVGRTRLQVIQGTSEGCDRSVRRMLACGDRLHHGGVDAGVLYAKHGVT